MRLFKRLLCWCVCWGLCGPVAAQMLQWHRVSASETVPSANQTTTNVSGYAAQTPVVAAPAKLADVQSLSPRALQYASLIADVAQHYAVDPLLVHAVIEAESAYRPTAVSSAGAFGLMQMMPATGARFGKTMLTQPRDNIEAGVAYLSWLMQRFDGRLDLVLAGYNAGEGAVARHGNAVPPYTETRAYVQKVMGRYASLNGQAPAAPRYPESIAASSPAPVPVSAPQRFAAGSTSDLEQLFRLFIGGPPHAGPAGCPS